MPVIIRFLIADAYSVGGTIRTTFVTAGQLASKHEVEVVSVYRFSERPSLELDPRVRLRCLTDLTPRSRQGLRGRIAENPSRVIHSEDTRYPRFNLLTDAALLRFLYVGPRRRARRDPTRASISPSRAMSPSAWSASVRTT